MKTSKGFKLVGCLAACGILAGVAIALAPKATTMFSRAVEDHYVEITAAQLQTAMAGDGTFTTGDYETWKVENVTFEDDGGTLLAKFVASANSTLYNTNVAGEHANAMNLRGAGFTGITLFDKTATNGSACYGFAQGVLGVYQTAGINGDSSAAQYVPFPAHDKEIYKVQYGAVGGGGDNYVTVSKIRFHYVCESASPALSLASPAAKCDPTETIQLTWTFKNVGGSSPTITFVSSDPSIATVSENGGLVTGVAPGDVTITASFTYNEVLYAASNSINITINDPEAAINYLDWRKVEGGPVIIDGAGMILAVDHQSIGYSETDGAAGVTVTVTGKANPSIVNFQKPGWAGAAGLYVTFADAVFSGITKIVIEVPHKTSGVIYTAVLEVENPDVFPTITKLNGVPYNTYMA